MKLVQKWIVLLGTLFLMSASPAKAGDHGTPGSSYGGSRRVVYCFAYPCYVPRHGLRRYKRFRMFLSFGAFTLAINTAWYPAASYGYGAYPLYGYGGGYGVMPYGGLFGSNFYPRYY